MKTLSTKYFTFAVPKGWDDYEIDETSVKVENDNEISSMYVEIEDLDDWEADDLAEFYFDNVNDLPNNELIRFGIWLNYINNYDTRIKPCP